jgi:hypothetical protein
MDGKEEIKKRKNEKEKRKRKRKEKNRRKRGNKKRKGKGTIDISPSYPHHTTRRSCFVKRFPKRIQLPHRIRSNSTATAGAATAGAGALPNAP